MKAIKENCLRNPKANPGCRVFRVQVLGFQVGDLGVGGLGFRFAGWEREASGRSRVGMDKQKEA